MGRKDTDRETPLKFRKRRRIEELSRRGIYLLPNLFTTANLFCGVFAVLAIFNQEYLHAVAAILIAMLFDVLDGMIARMTQTTSRFGLEYDSLSDIISFGVAPGLVVYAWGLSEYGRLGQAACFLYIACGALRLARYNVQNTVSEGPGFVGLPIPAAAAFISAIVILDDYIVHFGKDVRPILVLGMTYALAFLMVSTLRYRCLKEFRSEKRIPFRVLVSAILILLVFVVAPQITFFTLVSIYVVSGILEKPIVVFYRYVRKAHPLLFEGDQR